MNAEECNARAAECAAKAAQASVESVSLEFLRLAAQWRAMAVRDIFLGTLGEDLTTPATMAATASLFSPGQGALQV